MKATDEFNRKLLVIASWLQSRATGQHDAWTTHTMLRRKLDDLSPFTVQAGFEQNRIFSTPNRQQGKGRMTKNRVIKKGEFYYAQVREWYCPLWDYLGKGIGLYGIPAKFFTQQEAEEAIRQFRTNQHDEKHPITTLEF